MKQINTIRIPTEKSAGWHSPQALLHLNARLQEIDISRRLAFHKGWLTPAQVVENGEIAVSLLQTASQEICSMQGGLRAMEAALLSELSEAGNKPFPETQLKELVQRQIEHIRSLAHETTFKERELLNGKLGITGKGRVTKVLAGTPSSQKSVKRLVRVELLRVATHSILTGHQKITEALLRQETQIILSENNHVAKYEISPDETVESLMRGMQELVIKKGLDLEIRLSAEGYLQVRHRQYGSPFVFSGRSQNTRILSKRPNSFHFCHLGENCIGKINGHFVKSRGQLLLGGTQLPGLEGLAILWETEEMGTDYLTISHQAVPVPGGHFIPHPGLWISIRACDPSDLAQGVNNRSGFRSLAEVSPQSWQSVYDTLYLVQLSIVELEESLALVETKKSQFEAMAMAALETTKLAKTEDQTEAMVSENVALMATMLKEAFVSQKN